MTRTPDTTNRKNMLLLIQLRWIAAVGQIVSIAFTELLFGIRLPLFEMSLIVGALVVLNGVSYLWLRNRSEVSNRALLVALMLDVAALTAQLYMSGGASNPFTGLYLLQVTLAAVLLDVAFAWTIVVIATIGFVALTMFNVPLVLVGANVPGLLTLYIIGTFICFLLDAGLLVFFLIRITRNLRDRDARLAAMKQQAAQEDLIVRMGLLASGAAHELGTPLAEVAVILGDWKRMPAVRGDADMMEDIEEMQAAIKRCKSTLSGILMSSGEARGDDPTPTTVDDFLADVVRKWQAARPAAKLNYRNAFGPNLPIVSDTTLEQVVFNLLDNAFEASPDWIQLTATHEGDTLLVEVRDRGAGFAPDMLTNLGTPYKSTKGRGGGLGLFLVVNVIRKLGGSVAARNLPEGGAAVSMSLPLEALTISHA